MGDYKVWECKIVVPADAALPDGFDLPPRLAAKRAVLQAGINVISCFSGWGGTLTDAERQCCEKNERPY